MTMKLLLDTNVLVDYFAQRAPFARDVNRLNVATCWQTVRPPTSVNWRLVRTCA